MKLPLCPGDNISLPQLLVLCDVKLAGMDGTNIQLVVELAIVAGALLCARA